MQKQWLLSGVLVALQTVTACNSAPKSGSPPTALSSETNSAGTIAGDTVAPSVSGDATGSSPVVAIPGGTSDTSVGSTGNGSGSIDPSDASANMPPVKLAFASAVLNQTPGFCGKLSLQAQAADGRVVSVMEAHAINLTSSAATGKFYSDAACTTATLALTMSPLKDTFAYYSDTAAGTPKVTATDVSTVSPLTTAVQSEVISLTATNTPPTTGAMGSLKFISAPLTQAVSTCGLVTLGVFNNAGASMLLTAALQVTFASSSTTGFFYNDAACTTAFTAASLPMGYASFTAYYKNTAASMPVLSVTSVNGTFAAATQTETITAATTTTTPAAGMASIKFINSASPVINKCLTMPLTVYNSADQVSYFTNDVVANLNTSTTNGAFFSDSGCKTRISSVTLKANAASATVYYMSTLSGLNRLYILPTVGGVAPTNLDLTFLAN